jgi:alginate O-acetyltransferase complex protein AlgI
MTGSVAYLLFIAPVAIAGLWFFKTARARSLWIAAWSLLILIQYAGAFAIPTLLCVLGTYVLSGYAAKSVGLKKKLLTAAAIAAPLGYLLAVKWPGGLVAGAPGASWIAPLSASYLSFQLIHFAVERGRGNIAKRVRPETFVSYALFFPTLPAGPIKRYENFRAQAEAPASFDSGEFSAGLFRVALGFFKKLAIAQSCWVWLDGWGHADDSGLIALACCWLYFIFIYADFSGYSDIAIGTAKMMGLRVEENFDWPIFATNPSEFWKRWHKTLTGFVRDYIFIPMGGSRVAFWRIGLNTTVAMAAVGLWHGFAANFLAWGLYHAGLLLGWRGIKRLTAHRLPDRAGRIVGCLVTANLVAVGWIFFDRPLDEAWTIIRAMLFL